MANKYTDVTARMYEVIRYVGTDNKQHTGEEVTLYHVGRLADVRPIDLYPVSEQRFDRIPWAYKPARKQDVKNGTYRTVTRKQDDGTVKTYQLATNRDGDCIPVTLTAVQVVRMWCDAMTVCATAWLDGSGVVGYRVKFSPVINWDVSSGGATLASPAPRKKNRTRADDARKNARKNARATARANRKQA